MCGELNSRLLSAFSVLWTRFLFRFSPSILESALVMLKSLTAKNNNMNWVKDEPKKPASHPAPVWRVLTYFKSCTKLPSIRNARAVDNSRCLTWGWAYERFLLPPQRRERWASTTAPPPVITLSSDVIAQKSWPVAKPKLMVETALKLTNTSR